MIFIYIGKKSHFFTIFRLIRPDTGHVFKEFL